MRFSILIPVRDDRQNLLRCLRALKEQDLGDCEILVCDDGSIPPLTVEELRSTGVPLELFRLDGRGPAAARNLLAQKAAGDSLFFLDADTLPRPDTLACARRIISENPGIQAFFGSYDDDPDCPSLVSVYKNLFHHYTHQRSAGAVSTFWCGCGVVRRQLYLESGGLSERYRRPSIEDIELGMRLSRQGIMIRLFPELQVKHLKRWTLRSWIYSDLFCRGVPWVRVMRARKTWINQLNFTWRERLSAVVALAAVGAAALTPLSWWSSVLSAAGFSAFVYLNGEFIRLVAAKRGVATAAVAVALHLLYSLVCVASLVTGLLIPRTESESPSSRVEG